MYSLPTPGSDASMASKASVWRDIFSMLNEWRAGKFTRPQTNRRRGTIWIKNNTGRDVEPGELMQVPTMIQPVNTSLGIATNYSPILLAVQPTWHTAIDNIVIADGPVPDGEMFPYNPKPFGIVSCTGSVGSDNRYVMIDPDSPQYGVTASSGIFRVLGYDAVNDFAIVDRGQNQRLWRYQLTEDSLAPSDTTAKLLDLAGNEYASSIELSDPESLMSDQVTDDTGLCIHTGNSFQAIQAVC